MKLEDANKMIQELEDAGYEASLYENYSGRAMYGKTTTGVVTDATPEGMEHDGIDSPGRMDGMGLDYIYY